MSQHTPLPWHVAGGHAEYVEAANRLRVADCQVPQHPFLTLATREMEANAEFIVRACNSHTKLVEALQRTLKFAKEFRADHPKGSTEHTLSDLAVKQAEQALRLAQGKEAL